MSSGVSRYYNFLESESFERIMSYNECELESDHEFIQWLFPTIRKSAFNRNAPIIDIKELRANPKFQDAAEKMLRSLDLMKSFWGIMGDEIYDVEKFQRLDDHNGLRLSRVLQSLIYHDLEHESYILLATVISNVKYLMPRCEHGKLIWQSRFEEAIYDVHNT